MSVRITFLIHLLLPLLISSVAFAQIQQVRSTTASDRSPRAQTLTQIVPGIPIKESAFMIVVDDLTFENCKTAIMDYKRVLERGGLPAFVLSATWNDPEEVRRKIMEFHQHSHLEGVVLMGDIPVPMILRSMQDRNAVASDRFYDTFDLDFEFAGQRDGLFYYHLPASERSSRITSQIYSGRIQAVADGRDPYRQINDYLVKVIAVYQEENPLDQILSYQGRSDDEILADCLVAWLPGTARLNEQFPGVFRGCGQARFLRFDFWDNPVPELAGQLRREDLDVAVLHGNTGFLRHDIGVLAPNARFIILEGGDNSDAASAGYLFSGGRSVSLLSSPGSATHMLGLLGLGARIGQWARYNLTLESHILGDPAFRFSTPAAAFDQLEDLLGGRMAPEDLKALSRTHPWPDVQNAALAQLYLQQDSNISELLREKFTTAPHAVVRFTCLQLLSELDDANYQAVLKLATADRDELVRRTAIYEMANARNQDFIPFLIEAYLSNQHASAIMSALRKTLETYSPSALKARATTVFAEANVTNREQSRDEFLKWTNH